MLVVALPGSAYFPRFSSIESVNEDTSLPLEDPHVDIYVYDTELTKIGVIFTDGLFGRFYIEKVLSSSPEETMQRCFNFLAKQEGAKIKPIINLYLNRPYPDVSCSFRVRNIADLLYLDYRELRNYHFGEKVDKRHTKDILGTLAEMLKHGISEDPLPDGVLIQKAGNRVYVICRRHIWRSQDNSMVKDLGRVVFCINSDSNEAREMLAYNLSITNNNKVYSHPHADSGHQVCFGNAEGQLNKALEFKDYSSLALMLDAFAGHANPDDERGKSVRHFPNALGIWGDKE